MHRALALLLATAILLTACKRKSDADASAGDAAFWSWFVAHHGQLEKIARADEPAAADLARELHRVDPKLTFEVGVKASPHELVISADGIHTVFPAVVRLVAAAPAIPGWKVIAFRPRHEANLFVQLDDGTKVGSDDVLFRVLRTAAGKVDVVLYMKGMSAVSDAAKQVAYLELDSLLGEYDVEMRLGEIDIEPGAAAPKDARSLRELPSVVDALK